MSHIFDTAAPLRREYNLKKRISLAKGAKEYEKPDEKFIKAQKKFRTPAYYMRGE